MGLESQRFYITQYIKNNKFNLITEFTEIESGGSDNRIMFDRAIKACKDNRATLIVSTLDRLTRRLKHIVKLRENKIKFVSADNPNCSELEIDIKICFAEDELRKISLRTRNALDAKKRRNEPLGYLPNLTSEGRIKGHGNCLGRHPGEIISKDVG
ncbi:MAG: recombinase family protein [Bacteroidota bacterium]